MEPVQKTIHDTQKADEDYQQLAHLLEEQIKEAELIPHPKIKDLVFGILQNLDALHREALSRIIQKLKNISPTLQKDLEKDYVILTLLELYDLSANKPAFEETVTPVDVSGLYKNIRMPVWIPAGKMDAFQENVLYPRDMEGESVVIVKIKNDVFALQNSCVLSSFPLEVGKLDGFYLTCKCHGFKYDLRSGELIGHDEKLKTFPVNITDEGKIMVGFNIDESAPLY